MTKSIFTKLLIFTLFILASFQLSAACNWSKVNTNWSYTVSGGKITVGLNMANYPCVKQFWSLAGSIYVPGSYTSFVVTKNGTYKICMKLYDTCNKCDTVICKEIKVDGINGCKVDFTVTINKDEAKFKPSFPCNGKAVYSWKFGNGTYSSNYDPSVKYKKGTYEVCLIAKCYTYNQTTKKYDSCEAKICKKIVIKENPCDLKGDFTYKIGDKGEVILVGGSNDKNVLYYWSINNETKKGHAIKVILKPGTHKICLTIFNQRTNCKIVICKTIVIPEPRTECKVDFVATITNDGVKYKPIFPCNGVATYYWKLGDGTTSHHVDPFVKYKKGTYEVCLYAKCKFYNKTKQAYDSCESKICKKIVIKENPCELKGDFTFKIGSNGSVVFTGTGNGHNLLYYWTINNDIFKGRDFTVTLKPGTYKVCLTIYDQKTNCKIIICKTIVIPEKSTHCNLPKGWSQTNVNCSTFVFDGYKIVDANNNIITNPCHKYSWDFGDKTTATGKETKHIYKTPGTYTVCMKVIDTCKKCDTMICKTVTVKCGDNKCNLPKGWSQNNVNCSTFVFDGYKIVDANNNIITNPCHKYSWDFGDKSTATGKETKHEYKSSGTYTVCMRVIDTCNKCDTMICKTVTVNCSNTKCNLPNGWAYGNKTACNTYTFEGFMSIVNNSSYLNPCHKYYWNFGTNSYATGRNVQYTFSKSGTYTVCMKVIDTCNKCDTIICKTIKVNCCNPNMQAEFSDTLKLGGTVKFVNHSTLGASYKWLFGDNTTSTDKNISHTYANAGGYKVCLIVYDSSKNCTDTFCKYIQVSIKRGSTETSELYNAISWQLYPNPVNDNVNISGIEFVSGDEIIVKDITGKVVKNIQVTASVNTMNIDLKAIVPGIYSIECHKINGQNMTSKLIKQ